MIVKQAYELVNDVTKEVLGDSVLLTDDYSNVVDLGNEIFNANAVENYVKKLIDRIGRVIFVDRAYSSQAPDILMDNMEYGSVVEKIQCELPEASVNNTWELTDNTSYDDNVFTAPVVSVKFFNSKTTFEVKMSITYKQIESAFTNGTELNKFISMIFTAIEKSITVKTDGLIMGTINNMVAETIHDDYGASALNSKSGVKAINLLYLYNQAHSGATLTTSNCMESMDFIRFCVEKMQLYKSRITKISKLFNVGKKARFTPSELTHFVLLEDFKSKADAYLQSTTFNEEYTALPYHKVIPYWQGSGTGYAFNDVSKIKMTTSAGHTVEVSGILGCMFDRDALGINQYDRRVRTKNIESAEFINYWYKVENAYFNDLNENMIVFFIA